MSDTKTNDRPAAKPPATSPIRSATREGRKAFWTPYRISLGASGRQRVQHPA